MASPGWWTILVMVLVAALFTRTYPLAVFALMLAAVSAAAEWWRRRSLRGVTLRRLFTYRRGYPGESLTFKLELENRKLLPLPWLRVLDLVPYDVAPADPSQVIATHMPDTGMLLSLFSLRWYQRDRRAFTLLLRRRGIYRIGPPRLESGDLFGLFQEASDDGPQDLVTVFPQPLEFSELGLPSADPFGDQRARRRLYDDPTRVIGVREYRPEDDFRRVHWPATAHTGDLQVKLYQPVSARLVVLCLNVLTLPHYWEGTDPELLEYLVSVTATLAQRGLQDGFRVGLVSNASLAHADQPFRVPPGRSKAQFSQLLIALAGVTPFVTGPFDRFLMREAPRLPYGATLVIITGLLDDAIAEAVLRLRRSGRRVLLLHFGQKRPPDLPGVEVVFRPFHHKH
ncbi:MAG: DUF58 domain-containing protein [Chloroflexota bacterium]